MKNISIDPEHARLAQAIDLAITEKRYNDIKALAQDLVTQNVYRKVLAIRNAEGDTALHTIMKQNDPIAFAMLLPDSIDFETVYFLIHNITNTAGLSMLAQATAQGKFQELFSAIEITKKSILDNPQEGLSGSTLVKTDKGMIKLHNLKVGDVVACYNSTQSQAAWCAVIGINRARVAKYIKITLNTNQTINVAPDHLFYIHSSNSYVCARALLKNQNLRLLVNAGIKDVQEINEELEVVKISTECNNNFFITDLDILVHNSPVAGAISAVTGAAIRIGRVVIQNPEMCNKAFIALKTLKSVWDLCEYCQAEQKIDADAKSDSVNPALEERRQFDFHANELLLEKQELLNAKNRLSSLTQMRADGSTNFTQWYLTQLISAFKAQKPMDISIAQELALNDTLKNTLTDARQAYLDGLVQEIVDLRMAIGFHINELIDRIEEAKQELDLILQNGTLHVNNWNNTRLALTDDIALNAYQTIFNAEAALDSWEFTLQEARSAISYYNHPDRSDFLKKTFNIADALTNQQSMIFEYENVIRERRQLCRENKLTVEQYFVQRGISISAQSQRASAQALQKRIQRDAAARQKALDEMKKIQGSQRPPDKKDPKKDDEDDKEKHPHGKYHDAAYHHRNSRGASSPSPRNGQTLLDISQLIRGSDHQRIAVSKSDGVFVIFYRTAEKLYHGHIRTWEQLSVAMRKTLKDAKLVSPSGKIL